MSQSTNCCSIKDTRLPVLRTRGTPAIGKRSVLGESSVEFGLPVRQEVGIAAIVHEHVTLICNRNGALARCPTNTWVARLFLPREHVVMSALEFRSPKLATTRHELRPFVFSKDHDHGFNILGCGQEFMLVLLVLSTSLQPWWSCCCRCCCSCCCLPSFRQVQPEVQSAFLHVNGVLLQ